MKHVAVLVVGMVLLVLGVQGGIRLLADHSNAGILDWLPGGFAVRLVAFAVLAAAGVLAAGRGAAGMRRTGRP